MHPRDAEDLEFDDANEAHLAVHNITATEVTDEVRLRLRPITGWDSTVGELTRWRTERTR